MVKIHANLHRVISPKRQKEGSHFREFTKMDRSFKGECYNVNHVRTHFA